MAIALVPVFPTEITSWSEFLAWYRGPATEVETRFSIDPTRRQSFEAMVSQQKEIERAEDAANERLAERKRTESRSADSRLRLEVAENVAGFWQGIQTSDGAI